MACRKVKRENERHKAISSANQGIEETAEIFVASKQLQRGWSRLSGTHDMSMLSLNSSEKPSQHIENDKKHP